jgi:hypothetical protein
VVSKQNLSSDSLREARCGRNKARGAPHGPHESPHVGR